MQYIEKSFKVLNSVYNQNTYLDSAMSKIELDNVSTKIIYGVLEKDTQLNCIINSLVEKLPQKPIMVATKIGAYCLLYMDVLPDYAVVNGVVDFVKKLGKGGVSGFVNAILKKIARREYKAPTEKFQKISFDSSKPLWFVKKVFQNYDEETAMTILFEPSFELEHIRPNTRLCDLEQIKKNLAAQSIEFSSSMVGGLIVRNSNVIKNMFSQGAITFQSPSSILAVKALNPYGDVLDLCAAPGGKSILISEMNKNGSVLSCDITENKINQIKSYARRFMAKNVKYELNDGTKLSQRFINKFDCVLVDAPCSCFGTFRKHPDVFLRHGLETIKQMAAVQKKILGNAIKYTKKGGTILYSTCTIMKEENIDIVNYALSSHEVALEKMDIPFNNEGTLTILPKEEWDGFFIARFKKK